MIQTTRDADSQLQEDLEDVCRHLVVVLGSCPQFRERLSRIASYLQQGLGDSGISKLISSDSATTTSLELDRSCSPCEQAELTTVPQASVVNETIESREVDSSEKQESAVLGALARHGSDCDLWTVAARCRLKAEACRWMAERRSLLVGQPDDWRSVGRIDRELIARANAIGNCFLWMYHLNEPLSAVSKHWEGLANCFEALAHAASLVCEVQAERLPSGIVRSAIGILAEAQSAVWVAVAEVTGKPDTDQIASFAWLREFTADNSVFISRYMSATDPANPATAAEMIRRIAEIKRSMERSLKMRRQHAKLLGKVRHKVGLISREPTHCHREWQILADTVVELIASGMPPSNKELRELLIPIMDKVHEADDGVRSRLEPMICDVRRLQSRVTTVSPPAPTRRFCPEVEQVAARLKGMSVVIIGGDRRPDAHQAIIDAFGLRELDWIETTAHESFHRFESHVARTGVAVVVLAIRWASHSYGGVKRFCRRYDVPFVRLTAGYNPNQLAAAILDQCRWKSDRLAETAEK